MKGERAVSTTLGNWGMWSRAFPLQTRQMAVFVQLLILFACCLCLSTSLDVQSFVPVMSCHLTNGWVSVKFGSVLHFSVKTRSCGWNPEDTWFRLLWGDTKYAKPPPDVVTKGTSRAKTMEQSSLTCLLQHEELRASNQIKCQDTTALKTRSPIIDLQIGTFLSETSSNDQRLSLVETPVCFHCRHFVEILQQQK